MDEAGYAPTTSSLKGYSTPPTPSIERQAKGESWVRDYYDDAIPTQKGFITDFIFHSRGFMTPTLSAIWTALFILQSAIKREAWLKWAPKHLFTNQYMIIVGPAGLVKKTTAVSVLGLPILSQFRNYIQNPDMAEIKRVHIVKDKLTPEFLINSLLPENKEGPRTIYLRDSDGKPLNVNGKAIAYERTSEAALIVSELSTMLSKATYADQMTQILLDLYDTHDEWDWGTLMRQKKTLRKLCTSMIGATTVQGLRNSLPSAARGDGFLSRTIPIYVPDTRRCYDEPFMPKHAPTTPELAKRLAWIAENTLGEYTFSPEAQILKKDWYKFYNERLRANPVYSGAWSRMDVNVYKVALLIRAQRYDPSDHVISRDDLLDAIKLIDLTYSSFPYLMSQIDDDVFVVATSTISEFMQRRGHASRGRILSATHIRSDIATFAINELMQKGCLTGSFNDKPITEATNRVTETYSWRDIKDDFETDGTDETSDDRIDESINYTQSRWIDPPSGSLAPSQRDGAPAVYVEKQPAKAGREAPKAKSKARSKGKLQAVAPEKPKRQTAEKHQRNIGDKQIKRR